MRLISVNLFIFLCFGSSLFGAQEGLRLRPNSPRSVAPSLPTIPENEMQVHNVQPDNNWRNLLHKQAARGKCIEDCSTYCICGVLTCVPVVITWHLYNSARHMKMN